MENEVLDMLDKSISFTDWWELRDAMQEVHDLAHHKTLTEHEKLISIQMLTDNLINSWK